MSGNDKQPPASRPPLRAIVVMGVSGSGKTTIGSALAQRFGLVFVEGDDLHSARDVQQMSTGVPLDDAERTPWLRAVGTRLREELARRAGVVAACSALRHSYRDLLRAFVPDAFFLELDGSREVIHERMVTRTASFMPVSLLASQFDALEPLEADEWGARVSVEQGLAVTLASVVHLIEPLFRDGTHTRGAPPLR